MSFTKLTRLAADVSQFNLTDEEWAMMCQFPEWDRYYTQDTPRVVNLRGVIQVVYSKDRVDFKPVPGKGGRISGNYTSRCGLWLEVGQVKARIYSSNGEVYGTDESGKDFHLPGWGRSGYDSLLEFVS